VTAAYRNDRPQVLAILKSAGLPPPVTQNPAGIRLGTLNAFYPQTSSWTHPCDLGGACAERRGRWLGRLPGWRPRG